MTPTNPHSNNDPDGLAVTIGQHSQVGRKERNDDSYGVLVPDMPLLETKGIAMAIADGMSSSEAAKEASESCVKTFLTDYYCTHESWTVKTSVARVLTAVNRWLYGQGQMQYLSNRGMVSTFSGLVLKSGAAYIFHAGDSRIYLLRDGDMEPLTTDHRVRASRDSEYLSRAFGIDANLEVDYRTLPVSTGDMFVFTTDGVHEFIRDGAMVAHIEAHGDDMDGAARAIVDAAYENGSNDNLTCQVVRVDDAGEADRDTYYKQLTSLPFPPDLAPGMVLDGYRIEREMHASKRTQVYLATDTENDKTVVIKTPSVNFEDDPAYLEMFTREEWVGKLISNPHVLKVVEPVRKRNFLYYVTEHIDGQTLRQWMHDNPRPSLQAVRDIIEQLVIGLRAFHRKEMIHQDLKPENIVIDKLGTVTIIDFGSARVAGLDESGTPVSLPDLLGTVGYAAPEYRTGDKPTNRSDIYSLGVIAYEMLTGKLPYGEGFTNARSVTRLQYTPATQHSPEIPSWIAGALAKALRKDAAQRYEALSAFITDLTQPSPEFDEARTRPLLDRNPLAFWKWFAAISLVVNLLLLFSLGSK